VSDTPVIAAKTAGLIVIITIIFSICQGMLPWQPILWAKYIYTPFHTHLVLRLTFARAAPPAYDKKGNCYEGHGQTNYLIRRTQANQSSNK